MVGGLGVRVRHSDLTRRSPGEPVVVFEAGATNSLEVWSQVLGEIGGFAPVVAYDRAGLGESEWDGQEPTPAHVAGRLRQTLATLGAEPPWILVGFSWGGTLARYFAGLHPETVVGVVYVDPGPIITQTLADDATLFEQSGAGAEGRKAFWDAFERFSAGHPSPAVMPEFRVFRGLIERDPADRDLPPAPDVPVVMIVAGKYQALGVQLPYDPRMHHEFDVRHRLRMLSEWAIQAPHGTLVFSNNTGHVVPVDEPDLVVWAVRRVLSAGSRQGGSR